MKKILLMIIGAFIISISFCQSGDTITKKTIIQAGYVAEYVDGGGAGLNGFEAQMKFLFKPQKIAKGAKLDDALYFNAGYTFFPSSAYSLGQVNAGLGFTTPSPVFSKLLNVDFGLGGAYYHGTLGDEKWSGKKIDFGYHLGITISIGRVGGLYVKYWAPGGITSLSDDTYISPNFIAAGIQF